MEFPKRGLRPCANEYSESNKCTYDYSSQFTDKDVVEKKIRIIVVDV